MVFRIPPGLQIPIRLTGMPQRALLSGDKARTVPISPPSDPEYLRNENIAYL